jgi:sulfoxide reductase heme-binding subunit YedZ
MPWIFLRVAVFVVSLLPFVYLVYRAAVGELGADPADTLALESGRWSLRFLLICLAVTPVRELTGLARLAPLRRMFGLYALFYASVYLLVYLVFLLELRWLEIGEDIVQRFYITVGFLAFLILVVLGVTSNKPMMRRLGRRWRPLHRLVYLAAGLGLLHLIWILQRDLTDAVIYGIILLLLLAYRLYRAVWVRRLLGRLGSQ